MYIVVKNENLFEIFQSQLVICIRNITLQERKASTSNDTKIQNEASAHVKQNFDNTMQSWTQNLIRNPKPASISQKACKIK